MAGQPHYVIPTLETMTGLFYSTPGALADFQEVRADEMPDAYRRLLAHDGHMTVTVEAYHHCPVDVRVLETRKTPSHYARKILLTRQRDGAVVQFGIMRVNLECLDPDVRREIVQEQTPLGRILIQHRVLTRVQLFSLWRLAPGAELTQWFGRTDSRPTYGRTALIECNDVAAVELLEIVSPVDES